MKFMCKLLNELPSRGGWPNGATECYWHSGFSYAVFYDEEGNSIPGVSNVCVIEVTYGGDDDGERIAREQYEEYRRARLFTSISIMRGLAGKYDHEALKAEREE
ncbi:hypothetical protein [Enterobacter cloacae]|uniref:hypothetical protein n=1 Tax=Enterobacter cloacae TaxID=550 RepID=UPI00111C8B24|nr:hypothetical protein [Enterobacter cloacae]